MTPEQFCTLKNDIYTNSSLDNSFNEAEERDFSKTEPKDDQYPVKWIHRIDYYFKKIEKENPEPFIKKRIDRHTILFTSRDKSFKPKDKILLVCFTGKRHRMMMPLPVFLQYLNAETTDVIYMIDISSNSFRQGMPDYDHSFEGMLDRLSFLPFKDYKQVVGMGVSGGTLPILLLSIKYGFDAVLTVGAKGPNEPRWTEAIKKDTSQLIEDIQKNTNKISSTYLVYGADEPRDVKGTNEWKKLLPDATLIKIDNVGHAAIKPLIENGKYADLLSETIFKTN
jgi:hypothetical protein